HPAVLGRRRARPVGRPGDRTGRQLLQPGTLRRPHPPDLGPADRSRAPPRRLRALRHVSPHVPLRADVEPGARRRADLARAPPPDPRARTVRALRRRLLRLSHLRRAPAHRPRPPHPRPAPELLRRHHALPRRVGLVRAHAKHRPPSTTVARRPRRSRPRLAHRRPRRLRTRNTRPSRNRPAVYTTHRLGYLCAP